MFRSRAEQRRKKMVGVLVQGTTFIGLIEDLNALGVIPEGVETFAPDKFDHSFWVTVSDTAKEEDFVIYSTDIAGVIRAAKLMRDLESFASGPLQGRVVSVEILQRSIDKVTVA